MMMTEITLIFPDQLFLKHPCLGSKRTIYLVEEFLFFKVQPFHKQRLLLLKSAMRNYAKTLTQKHRNVVYVPSQKLSYQRALFELLGKKRIKEIHVAEFADEWLSQDLIQAAEQYGWNVHFYPSPGFVCSNNDLEVFFEGKEQYSMAQFYAYQRKSRDILMEGQRPVGGKYSFDVENRKKLPKELLIPSQYVPRHQGSLKELSAEVEHEFPEAIGNVDPFLYPSTHREANVALMRFLKDKLGLFGTYQDAIHTENSFLFHSVLSPLLNIGLLTPQQVIEAAIEHAKQHRIPINSLEGFLRQILGWREFVRASYLLRGSMQRSLNFFDHQEKLIPGFWNGTVGILPVDMVIKRVLKTGYCNHIERLMILGNFLLLTETSPDEVYRWFMAYFVDAYDWVMVPNVYGMSQYADGGSIVTKPYISSSNYILKMSDYPKGEWTEIWDGLFWRFLRKHRSRFCSNPRLANLLTLLKKNEQTILPKIRKAEKWLKAARSDGK